MRNPELINRIIEKTNKSEKDVVKVLKALCESVTESLLEGKEIKVGTLGKFRMAFRKPRQGRNPKTGESIPLPPKSFPRFKASNSFKEATENAKVSE